MICRSWQSQNSCRCSRQNKTDTDNDRSTPIEEDDYEYVTCSKQQDSPQGVGYTHDYCNRGNTGSWNADCRCGMNALAVILISTVMFWLLYYAAD